MHSVESMSEDSMKAIVAAPVHSGRSTHDTDEEWLRTGRSNGWALSSHVKT
jgi:hypothetical protein